MISFRYFPRPGQIKRPSRSERQVATAALSVGAGLVLALMTTGTALGVVSCRADPTVTLSNGVSVELWDTIGTGISNVSGVAYVLHVPKGVSVRQITYDSTGYLEHVQVVDDQQGSHYSLSTTATVTGSSASVTVNAIRRDGTTATKNGTTSQAITLNWCT